MQYEFCHWRARKPESTVWWELGWCMTEHDAWDWAKQTGHVVERMVCDTARNRERSVRVMSGAGT